MVYSEISIYLSSGARRESERNELEQFGTVTLVSFIGWSAMIADHGHPPWLSSCKSTSCADGHVSQRHFYSNFLFPVDKTG